ncbi:phage terminase small subunit [Erwinia tracheiphila]|uniref:phage terminase small subunit n=1 Tax=Erwinia tracheiphila TaxID=65700 RepID=UPI002D804EF4|nr:phage terminase small subunit [Erwinia tracheiphila]
MAFSPLQYRTRLLTQAKVRQSKETGTASGNADSLHLQLLGLEQDVARLRALPRTADRIELKSRELLPRWLPYVERYLAEGRVYAYPVFSYCIIWLFDTGDIHRALDWADIAIVQQQPTPNNIKRLFPAFVADHVLEWAVSAAQAGHSIEPYFTRTFTNVRENWRLHEKITAKWFKFAGELLLRDRDGKPLPSAVEDVQTLKRANELLAQAEGFHKKLA